MLKRIAAIQVLAGGAFLSTFTYIALLGDEMGLSRTEIAVMASLFAVAQFFSSYVFGKLADRFGRRRILLIGLAALPFLVLLQTFGTDTFTLWGLRFLAGIGFGIYPGALAAYAFEARAKIGRFASFQALGWGASLLVAGPVAERFSVEAVFYMASLLVGGAFLIALTLDRVHEIRITTPLIPWRMLVRNREVIFPFVMRHATASSIWVLWPLFLREEIGIGFTGIGIVLATNSFTQFAAMFLLGDRIGPGRSIGLGLLFTAMAVLSFIVIGSFPLFLITQVLLGLSWANLYVGSLRSMLIKNRERATAAGLLNSSIGLSALLGPLIALTMVELFPDAPYRGPMYLAGLISIISFIYFAAFGMKRVPLRDNRSSHPQ